jgi:DNA-binding IclR family transcriptional regulator
VSYTCFTRGSDVLRWLVRAVDVHDGPVPARDVAALLALPDGRTVTPSLERLQRERLVESSGSSPRAWWPTGRGVAVDRLVASASADRGGTFRPLNTLGLTLHEVIALQLRIGR